MSTGYVKSPTRTCSLPALFSLNCVIRCRSPSGVTFGEVPGELGVLAHVALHEERAALGVEAARDEVARHAVDARRAARPARTRP